MDTPRRICRVYPLAVAAELLGVTTGALRQRVSRGSLASWPPDQSAAGVHVVAADTIDKEADRAGKVTPAPAAIWIEVTGDHLPSEMVAVTKDAGSELEQLRVERDTAVTDLLEALSTHDEEAVRLRQMLKHNSDALKSSLQTATSLLAALNFDL